MSCGVVCRPSLDLVWLWLWCRPAAAAPSHLLAWDFPYAAGAAVTREKKKKKGVCGARDLGYKPKRKNLKN